MATNGSGDDISGLEKKIIRQVEYYFGDINLPRDKFLLEQIKENEDGWVTMETMVKFNRLKELSEDFDVIAGSLRKSTSGLIEVSEDNKKVRRSPKQPMPENTAARRQELLDKTLYVKPFPLDVTLDRLMEFFEGHGNVEGLLMRKDMKKKFKGSVFITFKNKEDADKLVNAESVKFEDTELIKKLKQHIDIPDMYNHILDICDMHNHIFDMPDIYYYILDIPYIYNYIIDIPEICDQIIDISEICDLILDMPDIYDHILDMPDIYDHILDMPDIYDHIIDMPDIYDHIIDMLDIYDHIIDMLDIYVHIIDMPNIYDHIIDMPDIYDHIIDIPLMYNSTNLPD
ncbi:hypothetical protein CHS0354_023632 [Potamilus streckersoni]|uniref:Uncharacterized protein n=1 Tax=Potamilus streckersoni TaxID=2493646 RepID=A0AAE0SZ69_9BIVA|nr:hypothetical protein CHS0354_023632 [Potamilus streckersoni]